MPARSARPCLERGRARSGRRVGSRAELDPQLRRAVLPGLRGLGTRHHIALTYDDGPDPASTPQFLSMLERHGVSATFFVLGEFVARYGSLVTEMSAAGHELAVHGWDHRCLVGKPPGQLSDQLRRTQHTVEDFTGVPVHWFRPPYGVITGRGLLAARQVGLIPVLWSAWGRDWSSRATPESIVTTVCRSIRPGGTVLLHDTDRTAAPGAWRGGAVGVPVGPQRVHSVGRGRGAVRLAHPSRRQRPGPVRQAEVRHHH